MHVALRKNFSGPVCSTDLVKVSKDAARKIFCLVVCCFFVSDVTSGGLTIYASGNVII